MSIDNADLVPLRDLVDRLVAQKEFAWQSPILVGIRRRLEKLAICEESLRDTKKRLEQCEAHCKLCGELNERMAYEVHDLKAALEQCEALQPKQRERIAACLNGNAFPETAWGKGYCAGIIAALTAFDGAARAALESRPCTCHPDDNPPRPCPKKYAYSECVDAARAAVEE